MYVNPSVSRFIRTLKVRIGVMRSYSITTDSYPRDMHQTYLKDVVIELLIEPCLRFTTNLSFRGFLFWEKHRHLVLKCCLSHRLVFLSDIYFPTIKNRRVGCHRV